LLEDVSATRVTVRAQNAVPPVERALAAIEVVARLHAAWWDHPRLDTLTAARRPDGGRVPGATFGITVDTARVVEAFLDYLGDALPEPRRRALRDIAAFVPDLVACQRAGPQTVVHGDLNWRNFFFPRDAGVADGATGATGAGGAGGATGNGDVLLFDWQTWDIGAPTADLGYMFGRNWTLEPNVDLVEALMRRYHQTLLANGVSEASYPWRRCWDDFRLAMVRPPTGAAIAWFRWGKPSDPPERWLRYVERVFVLHDALDCAALVTARA
jgi:aminoglycoside phosphotransferase (APT) family kinase protein